MKALASFQIKLLSLILGHEGDLHGPSSVKCIYGFSDFYLDTVNNTVPQTCRGFDTKHVKMFSQPHCFSSGSVSNILCQQPSLTVFKVLQSYVDVKVLTSIINTQIGQATPELPKCQRDLLKPQIRRAPKMEAPECHDSVVTFAVQQYEMQNEKHALNTIISLNNFQGILSPLRQNPQSKAYQIA